MRHRPEVQLRSCPKDQFGNGMQFCEWKMIKIHRDRELDQFESVWQHRAELDRVAVSLGSLTWNGFDSPLRAAPQGVTEAINLQEAGARKDATTGDFVTAEDVHLVISALLEHDIGVTAPHGYMLAVK